jgi:carbamoyl-phosphate synthase small subunit
MISKNKSILILEDGTYVSGNTIGAEKKTFGELVFTTSMTGYQESLTDPSYNGQILMFTYPLIGNYGIHSESFSQSKKIWAWGVVVKENCTKPSHRLKEKTIDEFLKEQDIPGISNVDTRLLTIKTRVSGTMKSVMMPYENFSDIDVNSIISELKNKALPSDSNLVDDVSTKRIEKLNKNNKKTVAVIDFGVKENIIKELMQRFNVIKVPYSITEDDLRKLNPDGIVISNGPGDPAHTSLLPTRKMLNNIVSDYPTLGICLGHQLLGLVFNAKTYKLKFGHRGANQPVKDLFTKKIFITSQNHGFAIEDGTSSEIETNQININDHTVEGFKHESLPIISVQYHPEASPGPRDAKHIFDDFLEIVRRNP